MDKTYVGFGFGPIQSGLFLYEAKISGNFSRFVVGEIDQSLVDAVAGNGGKYTVNIARPDRIDPFVVEGVELLNPAVDADRKQLIEAIALSDEIATCLPSVRFYDTGDASVAKTLAAGFSARDVARPTVIYASENHNHAAELLAEAIGPQLPEPIRRTVQPLNTVIGKMSGVIDDPATIETLGLVPMAPGIAKAILIEEFNRILVSRVELDGYRRGIEVFEEKSDLLPFEEAKLYGHNAIHALIGYLADVRGLTTVAQAAGHGDIMATARRAFLDESGAALIARHRQLGDPLFTPAGYEAYAKDLLGRMVNPNLNDLVQRVGRDPVRKLGWDDRLYGTMRLALQYDVEPENLAMGAAAGVIFAIRHRNEMTAAATSLPGSLGELDDRALASLLGEIWGSQDAAVASKLVDLTAEAMERIRRDWL